MVTFFTLLITFDMVGDWLDGDVHGQDGSEVGMKRGVARVGEA